MYAPIVAKLFNRLFDDVTQESYVNAQRTIEEISSVSEAIEALGILHHLEHDEARSEVRAVVGQIPSAVDDALMAAVKNAFGRSLKMRLRWEEGDVWAVRLVEERSWLRITVETPDGREFV